jgi:type IV pilus assembly protein PilM
MSILSKMMQESRRPPLACEITPHAVIAARGGEEPGVMTAASPVELPPGVLAPGWREANILDASKLSSAVQQALNGVSAGKKTVTVIVPDVSVRVLTLDFDTLPDRHKDALPIVRFRLRKLLPFDADTAAVTYQTYGQKGQVRAIVAAMPQSIRAEYESIVRAAGFEPGALLPATLAALPLLETDVPALLVHLAGDSVTIAIVNGETLLLHRVLELGLNRDEDIAQAIVVARAYFEDTLGFSPEAVVAAGDGSYQRLRKVLDEQFGDEGHITLKPLISGSHFLPGAMPQESQRELYGSVAGALS